MAAETLRSKMQWRALTNTLSNYAGKIVSLVTWFFLTPFILHQLGDAPYGVWVLIGSLISYGSLLDLGIAGAITKYVAENTTRQENDRTRQLVATALWLYSGMGVVAILSGIILAPFFPALFHVPADQAGAITLAVVLSGIGLGISLPATTTTAVLRGLQRFDLLNIIGITGTLLNALAIVLVLWLKGGIVGVIAVNIPVTLIMQVPAIWMINRIAPEIRFGWKGARREDVRAVVSYSSALFLISLSSLLQQKTDEVVVGSSLPVQEVTPYALAHRLSDIPQMLADQFMKILMPMASHLNAGGSRKSLQALFIISTRLTLAAFLPLGGAIILLARPFLTAWVGAEYSPYASLVTVLTLASLVNTILWPAGSILQGIARHHLLAYASLGSGIINLALSVVLVRQMGLMGVALGTLIPSVLELIVVLPYACAILGIGWKALLVDVLAAALIPALPMLGSIYVLRELTGPSTLVGVAALGIAGLLVYLAGYFAMKSNREERQFGLELLQTGRELAIKIRR